MNKTYSIIPTDWDYNHSDKIREIQAKFGYFTPSQIPEIVRCCKDLSSKQLDLERAFQYAKSMKEVYPFINFDLLVGDTWGDMKLVESF